MNITLSETQTDLLNKAVFKEITDLDWFINDYSKTDRCPEMEQRYQQLIAQRDAMQSLLSQLRGGKYDG